MHRTAIVVVSYGSHALLERHLARTAGTTTTAAAGDGTAPLVVVVDSWSGPEERAAVRRVTEDHGWELVALDTNPGFGAGVNAGARHALALGADVLVLLNPDLDVDAATVAELAAHVRREPLTLVSPRITRPDGRPWFAGGTLDLATGRTRTPATTPDDVRWLSGACIAVSAEAWRAVGGFDEDFFLYWEDVDLSWRALARGARLEVRADLHATHEVGGTQAPGGTRAKSSVYYRHNARGRLLFAAKHLDRRAALAWAADAPRFAWEVVLRGGRRQLLRSPAPLVAAGLGSLDGVGRVLRGPRAARRERGGGTGARPRRLLVAHPSPDLYGSDRQLLETVDAAVAGGWEVEVAVPAPGPLVPLLAERGARVRVAPFPVLRKAVLHPTRLAGFALASVRAAAGIRRLVRRTRPDLVYVNTVTIPVWLAAARLAGARTLCHVHEAEEGHPRPVAVALAAPLLLAHRVVANSDAARRALAAALPRAGRDVVVVHNGVPGPDGEPAPRAHVPGSRWEVALVARLSPRKGVDVALEAVALLAAEGHDVHLTVCGTPFAGYEWFDEQLQARAAEPDLAGRVTLAGYVHPTWPVLAAADVVVVPSRAEPFGNTAVEGLLARRPVVASRVQGLAEVVVDGVTGLLVEPGDAIALAAAVGRLLADDALRARLAEDGRADALRRFTTARYAQDVRAELDRTATGS
ncbi:glycosyltransferase [Actinotalea solisilvae]|uniref:glycosyltransferase n=1 Tax=Actinotalea solisilvae TaxID=2072922 RepID=UPI001F3A071C|nr:glycosyltransferase [Actinotalea solisilvae]